MEIINRDNLRVGDIATFAHKGHEFTGPIWQSEDKELLIGCSTIQYSEGSQTPYYDFVSATRPAQSLPTEPGSVILATKVRGETFETPVVLFLDDTTDWNTAFRVGGYWVHAADDIQEWVFADVKERD